MSCLFSSLQYSSLTGLNLCNYSAAGIKKVWIAVYQDITNSISTSGGIITNINSNLQWFELHLHRNTSKFTESLNTFGTFDHIFEFDIARMQPNRKLTINNLVKGKWLIIFQDFNGYYWISGIEKGLQTNQYNATTDVFQGSNGYKFLMKTTSTDNIIGVNSNYITGSVDVALPCELLHTELALSTDYLIYEFEDCIISDLPLF